MLKAFIVLSFVLCSGCAMEYEYDKARTLHFYCGVGFLVLSDKVGEGEAYDEKTTIEVREGPTHDH